jgi:hypothetical protein
MERPWKGSRRLICAPLHLERYIPIRDVRRLVWQYLESGDREMVYRAQNSKYEVYMEDDIVDECEHGGYVERMKWMLSHAFIYNWKWETSMCSNAAEAGQLAYLQWARAQGCPWSEFTCSMAAKGGHLHILEWLCDNGCPLGPLALGFAAFSGHVHVAQWLHDRGAPRYENMCEEAAMRGHLTMLQWALANGYTWTPNTIRGATLYHQHAIAEWARAHGCPE